MDKTGMTTVSIARNECAGSVFTAHREYSARLEGRVVRDEVVGPVNMELLRLFHQRIAPLYQQAHANGPFVLLSHYYESILMSPGALDGFVEAAGELIAVGIAPVAVAHVAGPEVEGREFMGDILRKKIFDPMCLPYQLFDNTDSAQRWLDEHLTKALDHDTNH